jgi:hypothetical protein
MDALAMSCTQWATMLVRENHSLPSTQGVTNSRRNLVLLIGDSTLQLFTKRGLNVVSMAQ